MSGVYASAVLKRVVALICEAIGYEAANPLALNQLVSITERFLREVTLYMMRGSELANRSEANLDDLAFAFQLGGINLDEMRAYVENVPPMPLPYVVGRFPLNPSGHRSVEQTDAASAGPSVPRHLPKKKNSKK